MPNVAAPAPEGDGDPNQLDPFDPALLRLSQDFAQSNGVRKLLTRVSVGKPDRASYIQTHPNQKYWLQTGVIELKEERETYLVKPELWPALAGEATFGPRALITTINRQGTVLLWSIRLPGHDGKLDSWNASALEAAEYAVGRWIRVTSNANLGAYEIFEATGELPAPQWPEVSMADLLRIAFKGRFIESLDHPVLRRLRGET